MENPITFAERGNVEFFKTVDLDVLLNSRDDEGESAFSKAVMANHLECCKEIYQRCPSLLYNQSHEYQYTALHHAAWRGEPKMVEFLINANAAAQPDLLTMVDTWGETGLHKAAIQQNHEAVKLFLQTDPDHKLSRMANGKMETALHLAVKSHNLQIVMMLDEADPNFEYSADNSGETPLLIAMRESLSQENTEGNGSGKIRRLLLKKQPSILRIRSGDNGWTFLHQLVAHKGDLGAIKDILQFDPQCLEVVDNEGRNFLHLAAKYEHVKVVQQVLRTKEIDASILNRQDNEGNTPLHTAALSGNENMILCFLYDLRVKKITVNNQGQRILDAIHCDYDNAKAGVFGFRGRMNQKELKDQSDFDLVVGALIAAVSFTAGITVPGGYISDGPNQGMAVLSKYRSFQAFVISNNFALMFSLYAVFNHFCTRRLLKEEDISYQLNVATFCTFGAILATMVAFITGSYAVLSNSNGLSITACVHCGCFFIFAFRAIWRMMMQQRHSGR